MHISLIFLALFFLSLSSLFLKDKVSIYKPFLFSFIFILALAGCSSAGLDNNTEALGNSNKQTQEDVISKESEKDTSVSENEDVSDEIAISSVEGKLEAHFIDVGQGDSMLFKYEDKTILIDAGDWQKNEVTPYLKSQGVEKIDLLVGTHPHADHIGQFPIVLENFKVEEVWMSGGTNNSNLFKRTLEEINKSGASYNEPRAGEEYQIGGLKLTVLNPSSLTGNLNDDSIVIRAQYGEVSFMLTGDAEDKAEKAMSNSSLALKSTILKAGHHGSITSTTQTFLDKVNPEVVIISVAEKNKYNHPSQEVIERIKKKSSEIYATKSHGNIIIKTDGKTYNIETNKNGNVSGTVPKKSSGNSNSSNSVSKESKPPKIGDDKKENNNISSGNCININKASFDELREIKHIDEVRAKSIIDLRPFEKVEDLTRINGIAEKRINDIKSEGKACVH